MLRQWIRLNLLLAASLGVVLVFVAPLVTWLLGVMITWSQLLAQSIKYLILIPSGLLMSVALFACFLFLLRCIGRR